MVIRTALQPARSASWACDRIFAAPSPANVWKMSGVAAAARHCRQRVRRPAAHDDGRLAGRSAAHGGQLALGVEAALVGDRADENRREQRHAEEVEREVQVDDS